MWPCHHVSEDLTTRSTRRGWRMTSHLLLMALLSPHSSWNKCQVRWGLILLLLSFLGAPAFFLLWSIKVAGFASLFTSECCRVCWLSLLYLRESVILIKTPSYSKVDDGMWKGGRGWWRAWGNNTATVVGSPRFPRWTLDSEYRGSHMLIHSPDIFWVSALSLLRESMVRELASQD